MPDTFFLSKMCPQVPQFNRVYWAKLEKHVRDLTKEYPIVEIFTGPFYLPKESNGIKVVSYQVIGENDVVVPTHFFKVLALGNAETDKKTIEAYILPNEAIPSSAHLNSFNTTIEKVEKAAGVIFFSKQ